MIFKFLNFQKELEKEYKAMDSIVEQLSFLNNDRRPLWIVLLEELDRTAQIFTWKDGKIVLNKRGIPVVNLGKILTNLPKIIAYIGKILSLVKG